MAIPNKNLTLPEIFDRVRVIEDFDEQIKFLSFYKNRKDFKFVVDVTYNFDFKCIKLNNVVKNYIASKIPVGENYASINSSVGALNSILQMFERGETEKACSRLMGILEMVSADEALLLYNMFNGYKLGGLSKKLFKTTFPQFFHNKTEDAEG